MLLWFTCFFHFFSLLFQNFTFISQVTRISKFQILMQKSKNPAGSILKSEISVEGSRNLLVPLHSSINNWKNTNLLKMQSSSIYQIEISDRDRNQVLGSVAVTVPEYQVGELYCVAAKSYSQVPTSQELQLHIIDSNIFQ